MELSEEDPWFASDTDDLEMELLPDIHKFKSISKISMKYESEVNKFNTQILMPHTLKMHAGNGKWL